MNKNKWVGSQFVRNPVLQEMIPSHFTNTFWISHRGLGNFRSVITETMKDMWLHPDVHEFILLLLLQCNIKEYLEQREFPSKSGWSVGVIINMNLMLYNHVEQSLEPVTSLNVVFFMYKHFFCRIYEQVCLQPCTAYKICKRNCRLKIYVCFLK